MSIVDFVDPETPQGRYQVVLEDRVVVGRGFGPEGRAPVTKPLSGEGAEGRRGLRGQQAVGPRPAAPRKAPGVVEGSQGKLAL